MVLNRADSRQAATPEAHPTWRVITDLVTITSSAEGTGDAVTVLEVETPPGGGIPPHTQRYEDESIYVLKGTYTFLIDETQEDVFEGETRFLGRGVRHGYVNHGSTTARMLIHIWPGGIHEQFIRNAGDASGRPMWESDMGKVLSLAPAYGIEFETTDTGA